MKFLLQKRKVINILYRQIVELSLQNEQLLKGHKQVKVC